MIYLSAGTIFFLREKEDFYCRLGEVFRRKIGKKIKSLFGFGGVLRILLSKFFYLEIFFVYLML